MNLDKSVTDFKWVITVTGCNFGCKSTILGLSNKIFQEKLDSYSRLEENLAKVYKIVSINSRKPKIS